MISGYFMGLHALTANGGAVYRQNMELKNKRMPLFLRKMTRNQGWTKKWSKLSG